jgi:hypothetical protein
MYMQRTTSGAAGYGLYTTIKCMRGASGIGMGTTIKHLRRTTSAAANNGLSTTIIPPCTAASFEVNSEPHTGARPSVRLCVGPEFSRCVHKKNPHERTLSFSSAAQNNIPAFKKNTDENHVSPSLPPRLAFL